MSERTNNVAEQRTRSRAAVHLALGTVMVLTAGLSLWISAPAWWPGAPGLHQPQRVDDLAAATRELGQRQRQRLARYQWRDREAGRVAIPIERAMELLVSESASGGEAKP